MNTVYDIPTMISTQVLDYLEEVGAGWEGHGVAVECGCWLGGSMARLCDGLKTAGYDRPVYAFDRWTANPEECEKAASAGVEIEDGQSLEAMFRQNVAPHAPGKLVTVRGRIEQANWSGEPIEIWLLDAAKRPKPFYGALQEFGPSWIPGVTIVGLMDFFFYRKYAMDDPQREFYLEQPMFIERFSDRFELLKTFEKDSPAFFRYVKPINWTSEL